jgi:hypothetical protein
VVSISRKKITKCFGIEPFFILFYCRRLVIFVVQVGGLGEKQHSLTDVKRRPKICL